VQRLNARTPNLSVQVADSVKAYITQNGLKPGDRLPPEQELASRLGVSRTSVREAMTALSALGVVDVQKGRGSFVSSYDFAPLFEQLPYGMLFQQQDIAELMEVRCVLEVFAAQEACRLGSDDDIAQLGNLITEMETAVTEGTDTIDADIRFHETVARMSGRRVLTFILGAFWALRRRFRPDPAPARSQMESVARHAKIWKALQRRDESAAKAAMRAHFSDLQTGEQDR